MDKQPVLDAIQLFLFISDNVVSNKPELVGRIHSVVHGLDTFLGHKYAEPVAVVDDQPKAWGNEGTERIDETPHDCAETGCVDVDDMIAKNEKRKTEEKPKAKKKK